MKEKELEWRMYGLVPYNISPIQQGIQYGHAVQEFNNMFIDENLNREAFDKWRLKDKTFIILNGGTTNSDILEVNGNLQPKGSLNKHLSNLIQNGIVISTFYEPDLGDQLTAVVFLVDERVFNKEKYPDFKKFLDSILPLKSKQEINLDNLEYYLDIADRSMIKGTSTNDFSKQELKDLAHSIGLKHIYENWVGMIGEKNVWLRKFLSQFKLA